MVNNEVVAVGSAEALGSELASVISRSEAQKADDDVVRSRQFNGRTVAFSFLNADAVAGRRLASDRDVGFADCKTFRFDNAANPKDHRARAFRLERFAQTAGTRVVEIGHEQNFAAASALRVSAITLGAGECQSAAPKGRLLRIHLAVEFSIGGIDNSSIELKDLRLPAGHIRNHFSIGSRNARTG